jgi:hypothetical protein
VWSANPEFVSHDRYCRPGAVTAEDFPENHQAKMTALLEQSRPIDQDLDWLPCLKNRIRIEEYTATADVSCHHLKPISPEDVLCGSGDRESLVLSAGTLGNAK